MQSHFVRTLLGLAGTFLTLASCGPAAPGPQAGGGIGGTGSVSTVASGSVTKFGSVFVSGMEYDNSNTLYCIDDEPCGRQNTLKIGMVVLVNGSVTEAYSVNQPLTRVADKITYEETVEGIVQSVAGDGRSLIVLGQLVTIDQNTVIDASIPGQTVTTLTPGLDLVEVSGFVTGDGQILATLIMKQTGPPHYEVQGKIKNHNQAAKKFEIGSLVVDYSSPTTDISQMPSPTSSWDGIVVYVRGDGWSPGGPGPYGARLAATQIKPQGLGVANIDDAEVEGFITQVAAPGDFFVNNLEVRTGPSTVFEGGTTTDLVVGAHVELHGQVISGLLQADRVSFEGELELQSNIATIDAGANTFTLVGLPGLTIAVDDTTSVQGDGSIRKFGDLRVGDHVKIHARANGAATALATEIERTTAASSVTIQGPVQSAADPVVTIAGVAINTASMPDNGFSAGSGIIGRAAFFSALRSGQIVSLQGTSSGNVVTWQSATFDD